jgi:hypothetical protein
MVNPLVKIIFDNEAKIALKEAYNYIKKDSSQNAEKVRRKILESIKELIKILKNTNLTNIVWTKIFPTALLKYIITG